MSASARSSSVSGFRCGEQGQSRRIRDSIPPVDNRLAILIVRPFQRRSCPEYSLES